MAEETISSRDFGRLEEKVESIDKKLNERTSAINRRLDDQHKLLGTIDGKLDGVVSRKEFEALSVKVHDDHEVRLKSIEDRHRSEDLSVVKRALKVISDSSAKMLAVVFVALLIWGAIIIFKQTNQPIKITPDQVEIIKEYLK